MSAEIGVTVAVLRCDAVANAVVEDRFEALQRVTWQARAIVDDHAGDLLSHATSHDASLANSNREALLFGNRGDDAHQRRCVLRQSFVGREAKIVGIAGVGYLPAPRQRGKPAVET